MMVGGGLMLLFGLLFMLIVIGLPILLIVAAVAGVWGSQAAELNRCLASWIWWASRSSAILRPLLLPLWPGLAGRLDALSQLWSP